MNEPQPHDERAALEEYKTLPRRPGAKINQKQAAVDIVPDPGRSRYSCIDPKRS